jgi:hypothetical protein
MAKFAFHKKISGEFFKTFWGKLSFAREYIIKNLKDIQNGKDE